MKKLIIIAMLWVLPAMAQETGADAYSNIPVLSKKVVDHNDKVKVNVHESGTQVSITVLPAGNYKWNKDYPAKLSYSICDDKSCFILTKEIKVKE